MRQGVAPNGARRGSVVVIPSRSAEGADSPAPGSDTVRRQVGGGPTSKATMNLNTIILWCFGSTTEHETRSLSPKVGRGPGRGGHDGRFLLRWWLSFLVVGVFSLVVCHPRVWAQEERAAQRLLLEGQRRAQQGDLEGALRELDLLAQQFTGSDWAAEGLLFSARLLADGGDSSGAMERAQRLIEGYRSSTHAAAAFLLLGELQSAAAVSNDDFEEARATFRRVPLLFGREFYPRLETRSEARVRAGELSLVLGAFDEAGAAFLEAVEDEPPSVWTSRARWGLATVLLYNGEWVTAAEVLQRVVSTAGVSPEQSHPETVAAARRRLSLLHRLHIRPQIGQAPWSSSTVLRVSGVELKKPFAVASSDEGRLLIADQAGQTVWMISAAGGLESRRVHRSPARPWFDASGEAYLPSQEGVQVASSAQVKTFSITSGEKSRPLDKLLAGQRDVFGRWLLLDRGFGLVRFDHEGGSGGALTEDGELVDLARDGQGRLYVLDRKERLVRRFAAGGGLDGSLSRPWKRPLAVAVDPLSNVYVLDSGTRAVEVLDAAGRPVATLGPELPGGLVLRGPEDLAVDGSGRIFIADPKLAAIVIVE